MSDLSDDELYLMSTVDYRERLPKVCAKSGNSHGAVVRPESQQLILYGVGRPSPDVIAAVSAAPLHTGGPGGTYSGLAFSSSDDDLLGPQDPAAGWARSIRSRSAGGCRWRSSSVGQAADPARRRGTGRGG